MRPNVFRPIGGVMLAGVVLLAMSFVLFKILIFGSIAAVLWFAFKGLRQEGSRRAFHPYPVEPRLSEETPQRSSLAPINIPIL